jgi:predicted phage terminase large subunit-like protein
LARKPAGYPFPTASAERLQDVDSAVVRGFVETFLWSGFDDPKPIPIFHEDLWDWDLGEHILGVAVCPRGHGKTTAGTIVGALIDVLFGIVDYEIIIGVNEPKASDFLKNIAFILTDSAYADLHEAFAIEVLIDNATELIARTHGREFCIKARGRGQKVRGELWRQKRPQKIRVDDLEDDEEVLNDDQRRKYKTWFLNAVMPAGREGTKLRVVGTILHADSLLQNFLDDSQLSETAEDPQWHAMFRSAHKSYNDFSEILWPEEFSEKRLKQIRKRYETQGNKNGYSQEYLGRAIAEGNEHFAKDRFIEMEALHFRRNLTRYGAIDFAVSEKKDTDNTAFGIGGMDSENLFHVLDVQAECIDTYKACELWFELDSIYHPEYWIVEDENIRKSVGPFLEIMMREKNHFLNMKLVTPKQDKKMRSRSYQARHNSGGVRYNKQMPGGYEELEDEMLGFPRAKHDDRVDVLSMLGMDLAEMVPANSEEEDEDEAYEEALAAANIDTGRNETTGY